MDIRYQGKLRFALLAGAVLLSPQMASAKAGDPVSIGEGVTLDPIIDARLRYETVDQDNIGLDADAVTVRVRAGAELNLDGGLSFLAEAEGTLGIVNDFNSTTNGNGGQFSVVADPENIELNRIQIKYKSGSGEQVTFGRQRINIDDQRFVGSVGWRQNEQTFDAIRAQAGIGGLKFDGTYAISARSIFGIDSANRQAFDGNFYFGGIGYKTGPVNLKGFAYLLDYDVSEGINALSSQTYGARAWGAIPVSNDVKVSFDASYATQSDFENNPNNYSADYLAGSLGGSFKGFGLKVGYEELGSDGGAVAFRTPLATLHKFNGFADVFLATPPAGLRDYYVGATAKIPGVKFLPGLRAGVTYHRFESDVGGIDYGDEIDALIGFKIGPVGALIKYANYNADLFGTDTQRIWFQLGISY